MSKSSMVRGVALVVFVFFLVQFSGLGGGGDNVESQPVVIRPANQPKAQTPPNDNETPVKLPPPTSPPTSPSTKKPAEEQRPAPPIRDSSSASVAGSDPLKAVITYAAIPIASSESLKEPFRYRDMTCPDLLAQHHAEYSSVVSKVNLKRPPPYKMPWYYNDEAPLCGRYLLTFFNLEGSGGASDTNRSGNASLTVSNHERVVKPTKEDVQSLAKSVYVVKTDRAAEADLARQGFHYDADKKVLTVEAGRTVDAVDLTNCGACGGGKCAEDVLVTGRLVGDEGFVSTDLVPLDGEGEPVSKYEAVKESAAAAPHGYRIRFTAWERGTYALEVKVVHINGSSADPTKPRSLGVIGIRASDNNRKSFKYNSVCDSQRHVFGSPLAVRVVAPTQPDREASDPVLRRLGEGEKMPLCRRTNHTQGRWVRFSDGSCSARSNPYCYGNPNWLTDACAYNTDMVWAPTDCKFQVYSPPNGPPRSCLKKKGRGIMMMVGDSVTREYGKSCELFNMGDSKLMCLFNNIALEGKHYSTDYAKAVVDVIMKGIMQNKASVFATNLGIHHMIGPCTTSQWIEFVDIFVAKWKQAGAKFYSNATKNDDTWQIEVAVWLGPPTIQYARMGMGAQRATLWDRLAWERLAPLGFQRLYAIGITRSRQEGTWDGLHYASQKGKVQSAWKNKKAKVLPWNGGVANMLFTMLINLVCNRDGVANAEGQFLGE